LRAGRRKSEAREVAVYLLKKESGLSLGEIGKRMGIGFSAVGNQWTKIKRKLAEDPKFGRMVIRCKM
jgi:chromosomal replication initiation ATPase DnaA